MATAEPGAAQSLFEMLQGQGLCSLTRLLTSSFSRKGDVSGLFSIEKSLVISHTAELLGLLILKHWP